MIQWHIRKGVIVIERIVYRICAISMVGSNIFCTKAILTRYYIQNDFFFQARLAETRCEIRGNLVMFLEGESINFHTSRLREREIYPISAPK